MSVLKNKTMIRRGDLFAVSLCKDDNKDDCNRPLLVIQNDIGNRYCNSVIVVPLSRKLRSKNLFFGVLIKGDNKTGLLEDQVALLSQIRTVEKSIFSNDNYLGRVDPETMEKIDHALAISVGLSTIQKLQSRQFDKKEEK